MGIFQRSLLLSAAVASLGICLLSPPRAPGATYEVGEGKRHRSLGDVPWTKLFPGDLVKVHWREEPYREKLQIGCRGSAKQPIRIVGVPGPEGKLPILDGENATTHRQFEYSYHPLQDFGVVIVTPERGKRWGYKPGYIQIESLEVRNAYRGDEKKSNTYKDNRGASRTYVFGAASIYVERGEHIVIRNCTITGSGNGLFVNSKSSEEVQSRDILVEGCHVYGNGNVGRDREHNIYTEAIGMVFQNNRLGPLRPGAGGNNLKDRSAGIVIRYNRIENGAHLLDLVEPQESRKIACKDPSFKNTFVYGNILIAGPKDSSTVIHFGGDQGDPKWYKVGPLHFYHNTVVMRATAEERYWTTLFRLESDTHVVDARNNIFYRTGSTNFLLLKDVGTAKLGVNWMSEDWKPGRPDSKGKVLGSENCILGKDPGFVRLESNDLRLSPGSPCLGKGGPLDSAILPLHDVVKQHAQPNSPATRKRQGEKSDLGALDE